MKRFAHLVAVITAVVAFLGGTTDPVTGQQPPAASATRPVSSLS